jgi:hypothetical protein
LLVIRRVVVAAFDHRDIIIRIVVSLQQVPTSAALTTPVKADGHYSGIANGDGGGALDANTSHDTDYGNGEGAYSR